MDFQEVVDELKKIPIEGENDSKKSKEAKESEHINLPLKAIGRPLSLPDGLAEFQKAKIDLEQKFYQSN